MAYFGSTAASSVANPPVRVTSALTRSILGTSGLTAWSSAVTRAAGMQDWRYISTNLTTDLCSTGFFTDGRQLGMQVGDFLTAVTYTSAGSSWILVQGIITTTNSTAGFNISTGGMITSTFS